MIIGFQKIEKERKMEESKMNSESFNEYNQQNNLIQQHQFLDQHNYQQSYQYAWQQLDQFSDQQHWEQQNQCLDQHYQQQQNQQPYQDQGQPLDQFPEQQNWQQEQGLDQQQQNQHLYQCQWHPLDQLPSDKNGYVESIADKVNGFSGSNRILQYCGKESKKILVKNQITNNASFISSSNPMYRIDSIVFRSLGEVYLYEPLNKSGVIFFPNCRAVAGYEKKEPDFTIVRGDGKIAILNIVDDSTHSASKDATISRWYQDKGINNIRTYTSEECKSSPEWVVGDFLSWLEKV